MRHATLPFPESETGPVPHPSRWTRWWTAEASPADALAHWRVSNAGQFLLLVLSADLAFIVLHFLLYLTPMENPLYSLERDRGYAEFFQYMKEWWVILLLVVVGVKTRSAGYVAWVLLFGYLLCDDVFRIHEEGGLWLSGKIPFGPVFDLRARDLGELAISAVSGAVLFSGLALSYWRGTDSFRRVSRHLLVLFALLVFCGVGVDLLHAALPWGREVRFILGVMEDGGEMVATSLIVSYVFLLSLHRGVPLFSVRHLIMIALRHWRSGRAGALQPVGSSAGRGGSPEGESLRTP